MRAYLRHAPSGLYFYGPGKWGFDRAKAYDFNLIERAIAYAKAWGLNAQVEAVCVLEHAVPILAKGPDGSAVMTEDLGETTGLPAAQLVA